MQCFTKCEEKTLQTCLVAFAEVIVQNEILQAWTHSARAGSPASLLATTPSCLVLMCAAWPIWRRLCRAFAAPTVALVCSLRLPLELCSGRILEPLKEAVLRNLGHRRTDAFRQPVTCYWGKAFLQVVRGTHTFAEMR